MTRIISGRLGGRRIAAPPGVHTRPTSDNLTISAVTQVTKVAQEIVETSTTTLEGIRKHLTYMDCLESTTSSLA
jgi:hypothetical protein